MTMAATAQKKSCTGSVEVRGWWSDRRVPERQEKSSPLNNDTQAATANLRDANVSRSCQWLPRTKKAPRAAQESVTMLSKNDPARARSRSIPKSPPQRIVDGGMKFVVPQFEVVLDWPKTFNIPGIGVRRNLPSVVHRA